MQSEKKIISSICQSFTIAAASIAFSLLVVGASSAHAQEDPDFGIEVQNNTQCSFINGDHVNIRSGPGSQYQVVTRLNRGDGVRATNREGNWVQIAARAYGFPPDETFESLQGWVSNAYINGCSEDQFDMWRR